MGPEAKTLCPIRHKAMPQQQQKVTWTCLSEGIPFAVCRESPIASRACQGIYHRVPGVIPRVRDCDSAGRLAPSSRARIGRKCITFRPTMGHTLRPGVHL
jgi:hypothetical protein